MSEELEWELFDIFEAGLFPFPIYEHKTARKIVRYLLYRGVLPEEIADAIEDTPMDLQLWLNRSGKNMVGEWVIAWVNETREDYRREKKREAMERGEEWKDHEWDGEDDDADSEIDFEKLARRKFSRLRLRSMTLDSSHISGYQSLDDNQRSWPKSAVVGMLGDRPNLERRRATLPHIDSTDLPHLNQRFTTLQDIEESSASEEDQTEVKHVYEETWISPSTSSSPSPPPLPPRTPQANDDVALHPTAMLIQQASFESGCIDMSFHDHTPQQVYEVAYQHTPDSGAVSDIYTSISPVCQSKPSSPSPLIECDVTDESTANRCTEDFHKNAALSQGLPYCPDCKCTLAHYLRCNSHQLPPLTKTLSYRTEREQCLDLLLGPDDRIHKDEIATLDRDIPGYIFVLTDSEQNFLPWSSKYRYKIASSRRPEHWLRELRARNLRIDLVWQVRVTKHQSALRDVYDRLNPYWLHSNWYKCSLSTIMDVVSCVARKFKP